MANSIETVETLNIRIPNYIPLEMNGNIVENISELSVSVADLLTDIPDEDILHVDKESIVIRKNDQSADLIQKFKQLNTKSPDITGSVFRDEKALIKSLSQGGRMVFSFCYEMPTNLDTMKDIQNADIFLESFFLWREINKRCEHDFYVLHETRRGDFTSMEFFLQRNFIFTSEKDFMMTKCFLSSSDFWDFAVDTKWKAAHKEFGWGGDFSFHMNWLMSCKVIEKGKPSCAKRLRHS